MRVDLEGGSSSLQQEGLVKVLQGGGGGGVIDIVTYLWYNEGLWYFNFTYL